jgi:iron complex transport system ATP-binding protein
VKHLHADGITVRYRGQYALFEVHISIEPASVTAIIGPNGSGKSTLLRCLAGVQIPTGGCVRLDGLPLPSFRASVLSRRLAYVPQNNPMPFDFTVEELVGLSGGTLEQTDQALRAMEIVHLRQRSVVTLSGGERQRAAIARAVAQETEYLLLDEPTAHLDLRHQQTVLQIARQRTQQDKTVILVLHDINLAIAGADQILLLTEGRIIAAGTPADVMTEENLQKAYGIIPRFTTEDATGRRYLLPSTSDAVI